MHHPFPLQMRAYMSNEAREWCTDDAAVANALSRVVHDSEPAQFHEEVFTFYLHVEFWQSVMFYIRNYLSLEQERRQGSHGQCTIFRLPDT